MGCATTARQPSRPGTGCATRLTPPPVSLSLRFTHEQVRYEPEYVVRILTQTASRFAIATK